MEHHLGHYGQIWFLGVFTHTHPSLGWNGFDNNIVGVTGYATVSHVALHILLSIVVSGDLFPQVHQA